MLSRLSHYLNRIAEGICLGLIVVMTGVTFAQVFFRFVIVHSLPWSEEFSRYCLVWASFLGASIALKRGLHIGVETVVERLPKSKRRFIHLLTLIILLLFLLVVIIKGLEMAVFNLRQSSPAMRIPMGLPYLAVPVGSFFMFVHLFSELILGWKQDGKLTERDRTGREKRLEVGL